MMNEDKEEVKTDCSLKKTRVALNVSPFRELGMVTNSTNIRENSVN